MVDKIKRFPRLLQGDQAAALTRMFWTAPEAPRIRVAKDGRSVNFVFKVRIPKEALGEPFQRYWSSLLAPPSHRFEKALQQGYDQIMSGKDTAHDQISNFLRRACVGALSVLLQDSWGLKGYEHLKEGQLDVFRRQTSKKYSLQPNSGAAITAFRSYEKYLPSVREARAKLKKTVPLTAGRALSIVMKQGLPPEALLNALRKISGSPDLSQLTLKGISPAEITRAIVEMEMSDVDFKKISFRTYRDLGKKLLAKKVWD
jgi:hypothetical protein